MKILLFGPNGSGKGTQGAFLRREYGIAHIESGAIFRDNISRGTELGERARGFIEEGNLVPDSITIPMILHRLGEDDCAKGWLLDGYPRNRRQAVALQAALAAQGVRLDLVVEILLNREIAKNRIVGRRLCARDPNHPNNVFIEAIAPVAGKCRLCGGDLETRSDDQDEEAIAHRHDIYFDEVDGTLAAAHFFRELAENDHRPGYLTIDGRPGLDEVHAELTEKLRVQTT